MMSTLDQVTSAVDVSTDDDLLVIPFSLHAERAVSNVPVSAGFCCPKGRLTEEQFPRSGRGNESPALVSDGCAQALPSPEARPSQREGEAGAAACRSGRGHESPALVSAPVRFASGETVAADLRVLNRWADGSVRWVLASFVTGELAAGRNKAELCIDESTSPSLREGRASGEGRASAQQTVAAAGDSLPRPLRGVAKSPSPSLREGRASGEGRGCAQQTVTAAGDSLPRPLRGDRQLELSLNDTTIQLQPTLTLTSGAIADLEQTACRQAVAGSQRQQWICDYTVTGEADVSLRATIDIWPETGVVDVSTRLRNGRRAIHPGGLWDLGDAGSLLFEGLSWKIVLEGDDATEAQLSLDGGGTFQPVSSGFELVQHSSGGPNWDSSNHVGANGKVAASKRGYELVVDEATSPPRPVASSVHSGDHASPTWVMSSGCRGSLRSAQPTNQTDTAAGDSLPRPLRCAVAIPEFWQQFPGSLSLKEKSQVEVGLFPKQFHSPFELQGGEQKTKRFVLLLSSTNDDNSSNNKLDWVHAPVHVVPDADWVRECNVIPWLPHDATEQRLTSYLRDCTTGDRSLHNRRQTIDEYGWRNFGDIHADHEQTHFAGSDTVVSHYNNQFDLIFGGIQNLITSGNPDWYELFAPMARHVMDIDIYHTDKDRPCFNGGLFWHTDHYVDARTATHRTYSAANAEDKSSYGGGPANEHNYPTGLLYYHFLTGNTEAAESVISLADWVIAMDDGQETLFAVLDTEDTGLASKTVFEDFHGPGRGVGNSINACLDGWLLTADAKYMDKAEQLIRRSVHPEQDLDELHLADAEGHWSYTVCLTALGRYLHIKHADDQPDEMYEYVRQTLDHYGRWMTENEKPSLSVPEDLEYPTEAWAAQDFRKANALRIAASCCHDDDWATRMRTKADELNEAAWEDLYRFGDAHLTARCFSIIMTEGLRELYHTSNAASPFPVGEDPGPLPEWTMFELQKHRVKATLKNPGRLMKAVLSNVRPSTIAKSWKAFRRQRQS